MADVKDGAHPHHCQRHASCLHDGRLSRLCGTLCGRHDRPLLESGQRGVARLDALGFCVQVVHRAFQTVSGDSPREAIQIWGHVLGVYLLAELDEAVALVIPREQPCATHPA
jgi:hypothetical protein